MPVAASLLEQTANQVMPAPCSLIRLPDRDVMADNLLGKQTNFPGASLTRSSGGGGRPRQRWGAGRTNSRQAALCPASCCCDSPVRSIQDY